MCREEITASFSPPASEFSYEEMVNCLESRGTGIVFFLLVIFSSLGYSCNFENDPISTDYMKQIDALSQYMITDYQVKRPRVISEEKKDQNCFHLLNLFLSNYSLANLKLLSKPKSKLEEMITEVQYETHFIGECSFKIPSKCPNETVTISTVLHDLNVSLAALKPHIENNFTHCLNVKCAAEHANTLKTTIATRRHNKNHQDSSEEHTTPTVKLKDSSLDHLSGEHAVESRGKRSPAPWISALIVFILIVNL